MADDEYSPRQLLIETRRGQLIWETKDANTTRLSRKFQPQNGYVALPEVVTITREPFKQAPPGQRYTLLIMGEESKKVPSDLGDALSILGDYLFATDIHQD